MSEEIFGGWVDKTKHPLENGFDLGQFYQRIPYEFLRGLLTITTPLYGCMVEKYSRWNGDKIIINNRCVDTFSTVRQRVIQGVDLAFLPDDVYILVQAEDRIYVLAFCKFPDDRFVGCLTHNDSAKAIDQLLDFIDSFRGQREKNTGNYIDLNISNLEPKRDYWRKNLSDVEDF